MKITSVLGKEEIRSLVQCSDLKGFQAVGTTWGLIALSFGFVAIYPSVFSILSALVILGGRQLALAILMHDAAHYSLFRTRRLNDWLGVWLCANPVAQDLPKYRVHHLQHHKFAGTEKDPDIDLVEGFPVSSRSLMRKLMRDLLGVTGLKRIYGIILMDLGHIQYTVSSRVVPISSDRRPSWGVVLKNLSGKVLMQLLLILLLTAVGKPELYLLWIVAYLTTFSVFIRIRSIAEHACLKQGIDPLSNTRTTYANWLERLTVAPHRVNFHLEHHLLMTVPYFKLPQLHQRLKGAGELKNASIANGYLEVLRLASAKT